MVLFVRSLDAREVWTDVLSLPLRSRYDVALLYLEQSEYDLDAAIQAFQDDESWEKEHPLEHGKGDGKSMRKTPKSVGMRRFVGSNGHASTSGTNR